VLGEPSVTRAQIDAVHELVDSGSLGIAFQPIVDLRRRAIHAYESLARVASPHFSGPAELFVAAARAGRVGELGRIHREQADRICPQTPLYLNIDPHEFGHGWLVRPDDPIFRRRASVTLEITESVPISYFEECHSVLAEIRRKRVQLAIDDFGAGYSNLRYVLDLEPEIVKLDRQLIVGLDAGSRHGRLVGAIVGLCHEMGAQVVAEGIETAGELAAVVALGFDFGQGYLLGRPANPPPDMIWPHRLF
jgi:EAL domain-containing protein (putative c-di-GMP-specific phosphodiesterase class I)